MKKTYRLHYACVDGLKPKDRTRNWLCLTMAAPNKDITTLAIDEDGLNDILHMCKDNTSRNDVMEDIFTQINQCAREGIFSVSITVTV